MTDADLLRDCGNYLFCIQANVWGCYWEQLFLLLVFALFRVFSFRKWKFWKVHSYILKV